MKKDLYITVTQLFKIMPESCYLAKEQGIKDCEECYAKVACKKRN